MLPEGYRIIAIALIMTASCEFCAASRIVIDCQFIKSFGQKMHAFFRCNQAIIQVLPITHVKSHTDIA